MGTITSRSRQRQKFSANGNEKEKTKGKVSKGGLEENHNYEKESADVSTEKQDSEKFWVTQITSPRGGSVSNLDGNLKQDYISSKPNHTSASKQHHESTSVHGTTSHTTNGQKRRSSNNSPRLSVAAANSANKSGRRRSSATEVAANSAVATLVSPDLGQGIISIHELYNYLNDGSINPCMCDPSYMLLFDARDKFSYENLHVLSSKHSSSLYSEVLSSNMHSIVTTGNHVSLNEYTFVIVYGNRVLDPADTKHPEVNFLKELESYDIEPLLLAAGFDSFRETFPFLCTEKVIVSQDLKNFKTYPSVVLNDQLYQGRGDQATNREIIDDLKITHIVNITCEHKSAFPDIVKYLTIQLEDVSQTNLKPYFPKAYDFIDNCFKTGGRVLIHCNLGVSRSSTITISYLMKSRSWNLKKAHDFLKDRRSIIRPNRGFLQQLSSWENEVLGQKVTDVDELWF